MEKPDAGLRNVDHYKQRLPSWRYIPRERLILLIRWETPRLARLQAKLRSPALDSYFAFTANLGTHTFFMIALPILFWCGYTALGRGMIHILASGVFFTGVLKDLLCLPRPLSPPLKRITMSDHTSLEYGFPSTHSTNAMSVVVYALFNLPSFISSTHLIVKLCLWILLSFYAVSIILGRLYCGMHGFFDVFIGSSLGVILSVIECTYGEVLDDFIHTGSFKALSIVILIILVLVRVHPEPADDCPCFDDSVAFAGVMCGAELGNWHFAQTSFSWDRPVPATVPFRLEALGWPKTIARIIIGVLCVFAWRGVMKPALLKGLPPIFRIVERLGLSLPRKFFVQASQYKRVPKHLKVDNVIPSVSEIPSMLSSIRHPRRNRAVSIGPQSAADAYETLAFREKRRRESVSALPLNASFTQQDVDGTVSSGYFNGSRQSIQSRAFLSSGSLPTPPPSSLNLQEYLAENGATITLPLTPDCLAQEQISSARSASQDRRQNEKEDREIFSQLEKPRVRYDVEVITKLIVYTGIAWLSVEGNPILFQLLGLGMDKNSGRN